MAGIQVQVLRRTQITAPTLTGSASLIMPPLAQFIDTLGWVSGALLVRAYANGLTGASGTATIALYNVMVADDDPSVTLENSTAIASVTITQGSTIAPVLLTAKIPGADAQGPFPIGRYLRARLTFAGAGNGLGGSITIGVDVIGRDA